MMRRAGLAAALAVLALPVLTACTGGGSKIDGDALLTTAANKLATTSGIQLTLTGNLPNGVNGLTKATGVATSAPAFQGDIGAVTSSLPVQAKVIAVNGKVWAVLPFTTNYVQINPADYGAPDPAVLMDPAKGLPAWLKALVGTHPKTKQVREGSAVLTELTSKLSGKLVAALIPTADAKADFAAVVRIDSAGKATFLSLTGPFYPGSSDVTYQATITQYDVSKAIKAP